MNNLEKYRAEFPHTELDMVYVDTHGLCQWVSTFLIAMAI